VDYFISPDAHAHKCQSTPLRFGTRIISLLQSMNPILLWEAQEIAPEISAWVATYLVTGTHTSLVALVLCNALATGFFNCIF